MSEFETHHVTRLLQRIDAGDEEAPEQLFQLIYEDLRQLARALVRNQDALTLQPTALVHEAYLRLFQDPEFVRVASTKSRAYLFGAFARVMRWMLIDRARQRSRRQTEDFHVCDRIIDHLQSQSIDVVALSEGMENLPSRNPDAGIAITFQIYGYAIDEIAETLQVSRSTVDRLLRYARATLKRELESPA